MTQQPLPPPQKGSMPVALLAGAAMFLAGPISLASFMLTLRPDEEGLSSAFANAWNEAGAFAFIIVAATALATVIGAVLTGLSVRRPGLLTGTALVPFLIAPLVASVGIKLGITAGLAAITHADPADQGTIALGMTGETMTLLLIAVACLQGGALAVAFSSVLGLFSIGRGPRIVVAATAGLFSFSLVAALLYFSGVHSALNAVAHSSPADRATILVATLAEVASLRSTSNVVFGLAVLVALGGAAVIARASRSHGMAVGMVLVVSLIGGRGFIALAEQNLFEGFGPLATPQPTENLAVIDGLGEWTGQLVKLDEPLDPELSPRGGELDFAVHPGLTRAQLLPALQLVREKRVIARLIGRGQERTFDVDPRWQPAANSLSKGERSVPVKVLWEGEVCERCEGALTLGDGKTGTFTPDDGEPEAWKPSRLMYSNLDAVQVRFTWNGDGAELVRAAELALQNGHVLTVSVPHP